MKSTEFKEETMRDKDKIENMAEILRWLMSLDYAIHHRTPEEVHEVRASLVHVIKEVVIGDMDGYNLQEHINEVLQQMGSTHERIIDIGAQA